MDTVSHDDDRGPQHACVGCKNAVAEEVMLHTGVFACEECRSELSEQFGSGFATRQGEFRYPTPELMFATLTKSDQLLSPRRLQTLQHMRQLIRWAADQADLMGDPAVRDEAFDTAWLKRRDAIWALTRGGKGEGQLAAMQIIAHILAAAGAKDEAATALEFSRLDENWPEYHAKMNFEKFRVAVVKSVKAPDWQAIADALESASVGGRDGRNDKRRWNPETLRTEYQRWSAKRAGLRLADLLRRK